MRFPLSHSHSLRLWQFPACRGAGIGRLTFLSGALSVSWRGDISTSAITIRICQEVKSDACLALFLLLTSELAGGRCIGNFDGSRTILMARRWSGANGTHQAPAVSFLKLLVVCLRGFFDEPIDTTIPTLRSQWRETADATRRKKTEVHKCLRARSGGFVVFWLACPNRSLRRPRP